jgi:hypothetical protein
MGASLPSPAHHSASGLYTTCPTLGHRCSSQSTMRYREIRPVADPDRENQNLSRTRVRWSPSLFRPWRRAKPCIMDTIDHKQISWIVNREC